MKKTPKKQASLWQGPEVDGVTQSMLSLFMVCRERFRVKYVLGYKPADTFRHKMEFGHLWHTCEEALASGVPDIFGPLRAHRQRLMERYKTQQAEVDHWYNVCRVTFPIYVDYWKKHPDVKNRTPLLQEHTFRVPYKLPSGRVVHLRGKWDSVDLVKTGKTNEILLQENKTKGDLDEQQLRKQLTFDLQTMLYFIALSISDEISLGSPLVGVRYNVIKRPLSGGIDSIRKHKPSKSNPRGETDEEFYDRLAGLIADHPQEYFMRWRVELHGGDVQKFKDQCLHPWLEQLWDWWEDQQSGQDSPFSGYHTHSRFPFGVYNSLIERGSHDLDEYLATGSTIGLQRATTLFDELEDA